MAVKIIDGFDTELTGQQYEMQVMMQRIENGTTIYVKNKIREWKNKTIEEDKHNE